MNCCQKSCPPAYPLLPLVHLFKIGWIHSSTDKGVFLVQPIRLDIRLELRRTSALLLPISFEFHRATLPGPLLSLPLLGSSPFKRLYLNWQGYTAPSLAGLYSTLLRCTLAMQRLY